MDGREEKEIGTRIRRRTMAAMVLRWFKVWVVVRTATAWTTTRPPPGLTRRLSPRVRSDKGFGTKPAVEKKIAELQRDQRQLKATKPVAAQPSETPQTQSELLQQLLEDEKVRKETLRVQVEDLKERDEFVRQNKDAGVIPDAVSNRKAARMALFGGIPTFGGIGLFVFFYLSAQGDNVFQPTIVAAATTAPWVVGLLGIGYGALSASWDEDRKGSVLGIDEFKLNIQRITDGLSRSANDANLRDSLADAAQRQAKRNQDAKRATKKKKKKSTTSSSSKK